jgi:hypothetical protein
MKRILYLKKLPSEIKRKEEYKKPENKTKNPKIKQKTRK